MTDDVTTGDAAIHQLRAMLDAAAGLVRELANDSVLARLVEAFRLMPFEDRATIVGAIEREVQARRLSCAVEKTTGQSMHPNPHARLYVRAHEKILPRYGLERDELMLAMLRAMRVAPILLAPEIHEAWRDGTREALEHLDAEIRATVAHLLREALAMVESDATSTADADVSARAV
jgi:hypothetical protein